MNENHEVKIKKKKKNIKVMQRSAHGFYKSMRKARGFSQHGKKIKKKKKKKKKRKSELQALEVKLMFDFSTSFIIFIFIFFS